MKDKNHQLPSWKNIFVKIGIFYFGLLVFCISLFFCIQNYYHRNYSAEKLESMMTTVSKYRDMTDDPCKYSISGDPLTAKNNYAKIFLHCQNGTVSGNTLDLRAIKGKTWYDLFFESGRINGYTVSLKNNTLKLGAFDNLWNCYLGTQKVNDFQQIAMPTTRIDCYYGTTPPIEK